MDCKSPITVLVVDDHPVVRDGLIAMISSQTDMQVLGDVGRGLEAVEAYTRFRPALVVMDLLLPDISGSEAIRRIRERSPNAAVLVLTSLEGDEEIYRAMEAGARGYLLKDMVRQDLLRAIREVAAGKRFIAPRAGSTIAENFPRPEMSQREIDVLNGIAGGLKNKEIAHQLGLTESTVNTHIKHILSKLNARDRTQAAIVALRRGIIRL
jgi:two-component system NarL family response regulator